MSLRCIAVDWSGAKIGAEKRIWLAEVRGDRLLRLENGRRADALAEHLIECAAAGPDLAVGLDFAFSFPSWFLDDLGVGSARELWELAARLGESWLLECSPPFWGRPGRSRPPGDVSRGYRVAELSLGFRPKSVFQIGGAGSVGTGSIRGMPVLSRLSMAGFGIWPFDPPRLPLVLEIYPRLLTGAVVKSSAPQRAAYLELHLPDLEPHFRSIAEGSEDAFDAAISALVMARHQDAIRQLNAPSTLLARREGLIWQPGELPGSEAARD